MAKIDQEKITPNRGTRYPPPHDVPCRGRIWWALGTAAGLTQFGVHRLVLPPGTWSSQRHWHSHEDEFVYVLSGDVILVTDAGEEPLRAGDAVGFKAGTGDGHHLQNRSDSDAELLIVGSRDERDHGEYSDIDMVFDVGRYSGKPYYKHKDGTPY
ncbi:MAG: cupin domain-containing protein [Steroidobacteraceae bacterium]